MVIFKKRRNREIVWGQDNKVREESEIPKREVILGPAGDSSVNENTVNENAMGFLGTMAAAASSGSESTENERPKTSPYGWEPDSNYNNSSSSYSDSSSSSNSGYLNSDSSDNFEKMMRLQRKIDNVVERLEALERKLNN